MTGPRERDLVTGPRGLRLRIREHGPTGGEPVVVLHGYLEQAAAWDEVAALLGSYRVVVPDHRGHGLSEHVGPGGIYHFWDYVGDVAALIDDLGGSTHLVGHSMGGTMAALLAATSPGRVRRLALIEGLGPPDGEPRAVQQARQALAHRLAPPEHRPVADLDDAVRRMRRANPDLSASTAIRLAERSTAPAADGTLRWTFDALHRARAPQAFSASTFLRFLREITAPTLLVEGADSPMQHIPDLEARRASIAGARRVTLDGTGHNPHHTCPARLAAVLLEHLHDRR